MESGIKGLKSRLEGAGLRWSRRSAKGMLIIRGAAMAGNFDDLWAPSAKDARLS
jgi:hypothetical protein